MRNRLSRVSQSLRAQFVAATTLMASNSRKEDGQAFVVYVLIPALVSLVIIGVITLAGIR